MSSLAAKKSAHSSSIPAEDARSASEKGLAMSAASDSHTALHAITHASGTAASATQGERSHHPAPRQSLSTPPVPQCRHGIANPASWLFAGRGLLTMHLRHPFFFPIFLPCQGDRQASISSRFACHYTGATMYTCMLTNYSPLYEQCPFHPLECGSGEQEGSHEVIT